MTVDPYYFNTQVFISALYVVIPAVVTGVLISQFKRTPKDKRFLVAGLAGIAAASLLFFVSAVLVVDSDQCCEIEMEEESQTYLLITRLLSTPFALASVCFFYRGLSRTFNWRYMVEIGSLLILVWLLVFFI